MRLFGTVAFAALGVALASARELSPEELDRVYQLAQQDSTLS